MGKRELLLVLALVAAGVLTYQLTAPPAAAGSGGFSVSRTIDELRRHLRGNRASAETTVTASHTLSPSTSEISLAITALAESLTITGEDRTDVVSELHVRSNGYDDDEANRLARETTLKASEGGGRMVFSIAYPRDGRQRANLTLRVPSGMRVSVPRSSGKLNVSRVAEIELLDARGDITVRELSGRADVNQRGGELTLADTGPLALKVRGVDARLSRIRGDLSIQSDGGEVTGSGVTGAIEINANATDVSLDKLGPATAPVHATTRNGSLSLADVAGETRIDARNTEVAVELRQPARVTISNEEGGTIEITPASGGLDLDAVTTGGGEITVPAGYPAIDKPGAGQRVVGAVAGGGPSITLRAADGDVVVRTPGSPPAARPSRVEGRPGPPEPPRPPTPPKLEPKLERY